MKAIQSTFPNINEMFGFSEMHIDSVFKYVRDLKKNYKQEGIIIRLKYIKNTSKKDYYIICLKNAYNRMVMFKAWGRIGGIHQLRTLASADFTSTLNSKMGIGYKLQPSEITSPANIIQTIRSFAPSAMENEDFANLANLYGKKTTKLHQ